MANDVQPAFRREFLPLFRHEADVGGEVVFRDRQHLVRNGHFEIDPGAHLAAKGLDFLVLDMTTVFPQVNRDGIGARLFGDGRGIEHRRIVRAAGLADGGHVIDVHAQ